MTYFHVTADPEYWNNWRELRMSAASGASLIFRGGAGNLELTCLDLATTAWSIHTNRVIFRHAFKLATHHSIDLDGGGRQMLSLYEGNAGSIGKDKMWVIFSPSESEDWLYEADLWEDGRKDYEPAVNQGKRKFSASEVMIDVANPEELLSWMNESYLPWTQKLSRIARPHSSLPEWVNSDLDMEVRCPSQSCTDRVEVIPTSRLKDLMASGATLASLRERLACSRCGQRKPLMLPF